MAAYQYIYHMDRVGKTVPGGKQILKDIRLSFLPGAKIGVLGPNGSGKSTLMRIMAGIDTEILGEARAAEGVKIGYLQQEPVLDETKDVAGNVYEGVAETKALLDRFREPLFLLFPGRLRDVRQFGLDILDGDEFVGIKGRQPPYQVFQFTHVAGPVVALHAVHGRVVDDFPGQPLVGGPGQE